MNTDSDRIRNIALIAHGGAGKTTLIESLLFQAHAISTCGRSAEGTATMQTEPEEIAHTLAITPHLAHCDWNGTTLYIVDTPGYFNFLESTRGVLPGVDGAVVVLSAVDGAKPETERLWRMLDEAKLPTVAFINQIDHEQADFMKALQLSQQVLKIPLQPLSIPIRVAAKTQGIVDLISMQAWGTKEGQSGPSDIPSEMQGDIQVLRTQLIEKIIESNDDLLEKYLDGKQLSVEELDRGLHNAVARRAFLPVLCGSAMANVGIDALLECITRHLPSPLERDKQRPFEGFNESEKAEVRSCDSRQHFSAIVLKTSIDQFSGKLSMVRVVSGEIKANQALYNSSQHSKQKSGRIYLIQGKNLEEVPNLSAGQIGAIAKLEDTHTGDTICAGEAIIAFPHVRFADAPVAYAVDVADKHADKVVAGLNKLVDEDPTLHLHRDEQTHELILAGMGQTHLEIALERLTRKFGGKATLKTPRVPYRETIKKSAKAQGKLKKQTGGHGQFANCFLEVSPLPRGAGFEFVDEITGGAIPKQYIPSIKKGILQAMTVGGLAGFPVADVQVRVYDGSFHDVDSSDYAFQIAGSLGFKAAVEQAEPTLVEPIMAMDIVVPEDSVGDVLRDISSRRGRISNMQSLGGSQEIEAEVPMAEVLEYGQILGSLTAGRGVYTMSIASYREVPGHLQEVILQKHKKAQA